jgi:hypothetical protein
LCEEGSGHTRATRAPKEGRSLLGSTPKTQCLQACGEARLDSRDAVVSTIRQRTCATHIAHEHYNIPTQSIPYLGPHLLTKHLCTMLTCQHDLYPAVVLYTAYAGIGKDASILANCLKPPQLLTRHPTPNAHSCNLSFPRNGPECRANYTAKTTR